MSAGEANYGGERLLSRRRLEDANFAFGPHKWGYPEAGIGKTLHEVGKVPSDDLSLGQQLKRGARFSYAHEDVGATNGRTRAAVWLADAVALATLDTTLHPRIANADENWRKLRVISA